MAARSLLSDFIILNISMLTKFILWQHCSEKISCTETELNLRYNYWASLELQNQSAENAKLTLPKTFRPKYIRGEKESAKNTMTLKEPSKNNCFIPNIFS